MEMLDERQRRMFEEANFAHFATNGEDGFPSVSPVWVDLDGDLVVINTAEGRRKTDNVRRDDRVGLSIHQQSNPYNHVALQGRVVEITHEGADAHIDKMAKKYMGVDKYPWASDDEQRVMLKIKPDAVSGMFVD